MAITNYKEGDLYVAQKAKDYTDGQVATKQDTLTAGDNITIKNGVISAVNVAGVDVTMSYDADNDRLKIGEDELSIKPVDKPQVQGDNIDLESYNSATNTYTTQHDGYAFVVKSGNATGKKTIYVCTNGQVALDVSAESVGNYFPLFVKKGTQLYVAGTATNISAVFREIIDA